MTVYFDTGRNAGGNVTFSNGNQTAHNTGSSNQPAYGTTGYSAGKYVFSVILNQNGGGGTDASAMGFGLGDASASSAAHNLGFDSSSNTLGLYFDGLTAAYNNVTFTPPAVTGTVGDQADFAIDFTGELFWYRTTTVNNWNNSGTANPATGAGGISFATAGMPSGTVFFPAADCNTGTQGEEYTFTTPPVISGFSAWQPSGLPAWAIVPQQADPDIFQGPRPGGFVWPGHFPQPGVQLPVPARSVIRLHQSRDIPEDFLVPRRNVLFPGTGVHLSAGPGGTEALVAQERPRDAFTALGALFGAAHAPPGGPVLVSQERPRDAFTLLWSTTLPNFVPPTVTRSVVAKAREQPRGSAGRVMFVPGPQPQPSVAYSVKNQAVTTQERPRDAYIWLEPSQPAPIFVPVTVTVSTFTIQEKPRDAFIEAFAGNPPQATVLTSSITTNAVVGPQRPGDAYVSMYPGPQPAPGRLPAGDFVVTAQERPRDAYVITFTAFPPLVTFTRPGPALVKQEQPRDAYTSIRPGVTPQAAYTIPVAFVQSATLSGGSVVGNTYVWTIAPAIAFGDSIVGFIQTTNNVVLNTVTDNRGNLYVVQDTQYLVDGDGNYIFDGDGNRITSVGPNTIEWDGLAAYVSLFTGVAIGGAPTTLTFTFTGAPTAPGGNYAEYSGAGGVDTVGLFTEADGSSASLTIRTLNPNCMITTLVSTNSVPVAPPGYASAYYNATLGADQAYFPSLAAGLYSATWSTPGATANVVAMVALLPVYFNPSLLSQTFVRQLAPDHRQWAPPSVLWSSTPVAGMVVPSITTQATIAQEKPRDAFTLFLPGPQASPFVAPSTTNQTLVGQERPRDAYVQSLAGPTPGAPVAPSVATRATTAQERPRDAYVQAGWYAPYIIKGPNFADSAIVPQEKPRDAYVEIAAGLPPVVTTPQPITNRTVIVQERPRDAFTQFVPGPMPVAGIVPGPTAIIALTIQEHPREGFIFSVPGLPPVFIPPPGPPPGPPPPLIARAEVQYRILSASLLPGIPTQVMFDFTAMLIPGESITALGVADPNVMLAAATAPPFPPQIRAIISNTGSNTIVALTATTSIGRTLSSVIAFR